MKTIPYRLKYNLFKSLIIGICFTVILSVTALAKTDNVQLLTASSQKGSASDAILQKQKEIDQYVFEQHAKELTQKGFKVTHTAPFDGYVEVGITPFTQANADYLYKLFGKDTVKVVEGQQAVLMNTSVSPANATENVSHKGSSQQTAITYTLIALTLLGVTFFAAFKLRSNKQHHS